MESEGGVSHKLTKINHRDLGGPGTKKRQEVVRQGWENISALLDGGTEEIGCPGDHSAASLILQVLTLIPNP